MAKIGSKKKRDGMNLNLIDFVVLLLVMLCIIGAVIRIKQINWFAKDSDLEEYKVYFSVTDIAYTSEDALVVGDTIVLCENKNILGNLQSIDSVLPSAMYVKDSDGNVLSVNYPESTRIDVTGTIVSQGNMTKNGYYLGGAVYIAPGKTYQAQSEHMDFWLTILDIEKK